MKPVIITITLLFIFSSIIAKDIFSGIVVDAETNEPLIAATILEEGSLEAGKANSCISDIDGKFIIDLQLSNSIQIQYLGYKIQVVEIVKEQVVQTIFLERDIIELEEVVINGNPDYRHHINICTITVCRFEGIQIEEINDVPIDNKEPWRKIEPVFYPNPTNGIINLNTEYQLKNVMIFNPSGQLVKSIETWTKSNQISLEDQSAGSYFISYQLNGEHKSKQIILAK